MADAFHECLRSLGLPRQCREKVRQAALGLRLLRQFWPDVKISTPGAPDLGVPAGGETGER